MARKPERGPMMHGSSFLRALRERNPFEAERFELDTLAARHAEEAPRWVQTLATRWRPRWAQVKARPRS